MSSSMSGASIQTLQRAFGGLVETDKRQAAEYAYAIAVMHLNNNHPAQAHHYARISIQLFEELELETINDCTARNGFLGSVSIPDLIHEDVVRKRFPNL